ncbi:uncharacterized protein [Ptychodera flava]|uniref:uncharacterized protein n=1 Tax=Ptychodera flava TaxID=63121 RepID=UPI00396AA11B
MEVETLPVSQVDGETVSSSPNGVANTAKTEVVNGDSTECDQYIAIDNEISIQNHMSSDGNTVAGSKNVVRDGRHPVTARMSPFKTFKNQASLEKLVNSVSESVSRKIFPAECQENGEVPISGQNGTLEVITNHIEETLGKVDQEKDKDLTDGKSGSGGEDVIDGPGPVHMPTSNSRSDLASDDISKVDGDVPEKGVTPKEDEENKSKPDDGPLLPQRRLRARNSVISTSPVEFSLPRRRRRSTAKTNRSSSLAVKIPASRENDSKPSNNVISTTVKPSSKIPTRCLTVSEMLANLRKERESQALALDIPQNGSPPNNNVEVLQLSRAHKKKVSNVGKNKRAASLSRVRIQIAQLVHQWQEHSKKRKLSLDVPEQLATQTLLQTQSQDNIHDPGNSPKRVVKKKKKTAVSYEDLRTSGNLEPPLCSCKMEFTISVLDGVAAMCRAVELVDGQLKRCENSVTAKQQVRPSSRVKFLMLCNEHRLKMARHQCCPGCGIFCTLGTFTVCTGEDTHHHFHRSCITEIEGTLYCPHCGKDTHSAQDIRVVPSHTAALYATSVVPSSAPTPSLPGSPGSVRPALASPPVGLPGPAMDGDPGMEYEVIGGKRSRRSEITECYIPAQSGYAWLSKGRAQVAKKSAKMFASCAALKLRVNRQQKQSEGQDQELSQNLLCDPVGRKSRVVEPRLSCSNSGGWSPAFLTSPKTANMGLHVSGNESSENLDFSGRSTHQSRAGNGDWEDSVQESFSAELSPAHSNPDERVHAIAEAIQKQYRFHVGRGDSGQTDLDGPLTVIKERESHPELMGNQTYAPSAAKTGMNLEVFDDESGFLEDIYLEPPQLLPDEDPQSPVEWYTRAESPSAVSSGILIDPGGNACQDAATIRVLEVRLERCSHTSQSQISGVSQPQNRVDCHDNSSTDTATEDDESQKFVVETYDAVLHTETGSTPQCMTEHATDVAEKSALENHTLASEVEKLTADQPSQDSLHAVSEGVSLEERNTGKDVNTVPTVHRRKQMARKSAPPSTSARPRGHSARMTTRSQSEFNKVRLERAWESGALNRNKLPHLDSDTENPSTSSKLTCSSPKCQTPSLTSTTSSTKSSKPGTRRSNTSSSLPTDAKCATPKCVTPPRTRYSTSRNKARMSVSPNIPTTPLDPEILPSTSSTLPNGTVISTSPLSSGTSREVLEQALRVLENEKPKKLKFTPKNLYLSSNDGDLEKVLFMLADGYDPNCKFANTQGNTALHGAAAKGHVEILSVLIQAGGNIDAINDNGQTPLMESTGNNQIECIKYLIKAGANVSAQEDDGMSCLHLAAKLGHLEVIKVLLSTHRIEVNIQDEGGWSPLIWAAEHKQKEIVQYLLDHGADPNIRDNEENTSLHWAVYGGCEDIAEIFLNAKCSIQAINMHGDTPLHIAAREDHYQCVVLLLSRGANVDVTNNEGESPLQCAQQNSRVWMALQVNKKMKEAADNRRKRTEKIIHRDISRGRENLPIPVVNGVDDSGPPDDFLFITQCCETEPLNIDMNIQHVQGCSCEDDCLTSSCICAISSVQCWYDKEGRLTDDFNTLEPPLLFECNRACKCWNTCHNRVIQDGGRCHLQLYRTERMGWGVRTIKDIPQGTFVCEYVGEIISDEEADRRPDDSYLFDLENREGDIFCLDARHYGNVSRFINHLCDPNLVPVRFFVDHQDLRFPRIAFFTAREVKANEELGFDYGDKFWGVKRKYFSCQCGSESCKHSGRGGNS